MLVKLVFGISIISYLVTSGVHGALNKSINDYNYDKTKKYRQFLTLKSFFTLVFFL